MEAKEEKKIQEAFEEKYKGYHPPEKSNSKIANWSEKIWTENKGIFYALFFNLFVFYVYITKQTICSSFVMMCFFYLLFTLIKKSFCKEQECKEETMTEEQINEKIKYFRGQVKEYIEGTKSLIQTFEEYVTAFVLLLIILLLTKFCSDLFFLWLVGNLSILHYPLNKLCPGCYFKTFIAITQCIEGVAGMIECVIPRYEENN